MTVQELIDEFMNVKDKSKKVATDSWNIAKSGIVRFVPREPKEKKESEQLIVFFKEPWFKQDGNSE